MATTDITDFLALLCCLCNILVAYNWTRSCFEVNPDNFDLMDSNALFHVLKHRTKRFPCLAHARNPSEFSSHSPSPVRFLWIRCDFWTTKVYTKVQKTTNPIQLRIWPNVNIPLNPLFHFPFFNFTKKKIIPCPWYPGIRMQTRRERWTNVKRQGKQELYLKVVLGLLGI